MCLGRQKKINGGFIRMRYENYCKIVTIPTKINPIKKPILNKNKTSANNKFHDMIFHHWINKLNKIISRY